MDAAKKAVEDAAKMASDAGVAACDKVEKTTGINADKVEKTVVEGCETVSPRRGPGATCKRWFAWLPPQKSARSDFAYSEPAPGRSSAALLHRPPACIDTRAPLHVQSQA